MNLNEENVPPRLVHLMPMAEKWGIGDDFDRERAINSASSEELRELIRCIDGVSDQELYGWLSGPEASSENPSNEYLAFTCLTMAIESAKLRCELNRPERIAKAHEFWRKDQPLEAGHLIFEQLPLDNRAKLAGAVLETALRRTGVVSPPIERIRRIAKHPKEWNAAHDAFRAARKLLLTFESVKNKTFEEEMLYLHLFLAENTAKTLYNATSPPDPFDDDSGCWIPENVKHILDLLGDIQFEETMWQLLSSEAVK